MKRITIVMLLAVGTFFSSCSNAQTPEQQKDAVIETVSATEFAKIIEEGNGTLVDVRTPGEYAAGNIEGSTLIDVKSSSFKSDIDKLDKNEPVYVYCRSGARSMSAARTMESMGFTKVYNLNGGFLAWSKK